MTTTAIITSISSDNTTCYVHIPYFDSSGIDCQELEAAIITLPGVHGGYKVNDIVVISFHENELNSPVVLGKISKLINNENIESEAIGTLASNTLYVTKNAVLPIDTVFTNSLDLQNTPSGTQVYQSMRDVMNMLSALDSTTSTSGAIIENLRFFEKGIYQLTVDSSLQDTTLQNARFIYGNMILNSSTSSEPVGNNLTKLVFEMTEPLKFTTFSSGIAVEQEVTNIAYASLSNIRAFNANNERQYGKVVEYNCEINDNKKLKIILIVNEQNLIFDCSYLALCSIPYSINATAFMQSNTIEGTSQATTEVWPSSSIQLTVKDAATQQNIDGAKVRVDD